MAPPRAALRKANAPRRDVRRDAEALCEEAGRAIARGDWPKAEAAYREVVALGIEDANVFNNLATLYDKQGIREDEGFALIEKAHALDPHHQEVRANLDKVLTRRLRPLLAELRLREALPLLERKVSLDPASAQNQRELGHCYARMGQLDKAIRHYTRAIHLNPNEAMYYNDLGLACYELRWLAEAQGAFQKVLELRPDSVIAYLHLGLLANLAGLSGVAVNMVQRALAIDPNCAEAHNNLGLFLRDRGEQEACRKHYEKAIALRPDHAGMFSGYLLSLNDDPTLSPEWIAAEHRRFGALVDGPARPLPPADRASERRLRIAYLSSDLRTHSVGFFMLPLLEAHRPENVEVTCYATGQVEDSTTERMRALAHRWRKVYRMADDELAALMRDDGIDIIVELSGHTNENRLPMLARRAAPVQMTYLGYPNTTGVRAIDYRITDAIADPPGMTESLHTEKLLRLDGGFLAYAAPEWAKALAVQPLPAKAKNGITFGSFNNVAKINPVVLDTWAQVLAAVPGSRLMLKAKGLKDERVQERVRKVFSSRGIDAGRILLMGHEHTMSDHLRHYHDMDIALDTFPYNGTTTTCEALWMGTPVLTLEGKHHAARVGASLLTRVGLGDLVVKSAEDYVAKAAALASDWDALQALRAGLRERLATSPLMDAPRLARELEAAYREAWRAYCSAA